MKKSKKKRKTSRKYFKRNLILIITLILLVACIQLWILGFQRNKKYYEFYDINDNYGTSQKCTIKNETLICNVNGYDVPVKQFSKIE